MKKGRGKDKRKRKRRKKKGYTLSREQRIAKERALANQSVKDGFNTAYGLAGATTILGLGMGLKNKKFRRVIGTPLSRTARAAGAVKGFLGAGFVEGEMMGAAGYVENRTANAINDIVNNKTSSDVVVNAGQTAVSMGKNFRQRLAEKARDDVKKRREITEKIKDWAVQTDYNIRFKPKEKSVLGYSSSFEEDFWINFNSRKDQAIEFSIVEDKTGRRTRRTRKRKPHSEATKRKISESLKKNRSKGQEFKSYAEGAGSLARAYSSVNNTLNANKITKAELGIRERRKQFAVAMPLANSIVKGAFNVKSRNSSLASRLYAEGFNRDSKTRKAIASMNLDKYARSLKE